MNQFAQMALTGIGVVAPTGTTPQAFFESLNGGTHAPPEDAETSRSGQLLNELKVSSPKLKMARYMDPLSRNAILATGEAMSHAGIEDADVAQSPHSYGIVLGATRGACLTRHALYESLQARHGKMVSGTLFSHCGYNIAAAMTAIAHGIKGPNLTVAGRDDLGFCILRRARQFLVTQRAHTVFAGFTECDAGPPRADVPFNECAYVLCLERSDRAAGRQARVLAEISLQDADKHADEGGHEVMRGWHRRETAVAENADALSVALSNWPSAGGRYASLLKIGLLSHDAQLKDRFPAVAFTAGEGRARACVKLLYTSEEMLAT
jgi:3-oxoacyl-[acyl-carrier-protein] synthase II